MNKVCKVTRQTNASPLASGTGMQAQRSPDFFPTLVNLRSPRSPMWFRATVMMLMNCRITEATTMGPLTGKGLRQKLRKNPAP